MKDNFPDTEPVFMKERAQPVEPIERNHDGHLRNANGACQLCGADAREVFGTLCGYPKFMSDTHRRKTGELAAAQPVEGPRELEDGCNPDPNSGRLKFERPRPAAPVEGVERVTDDAPARVEPTCSCLRFSERVKGTGIWADYCATCGKKRPPMQQKRPCGCIGPNEACDECAAQPAKHTDDKCDFGGNHLAKDCKCDPHTDDRPAETIPEDHIEHVKAFLNEMYATMIDPCADGEIKVGEMCAVLIEAARQQRQQIYDYGEEKRTAETRIEVLEAALREMVKAVDQLFEQCVPVVPEYPTRWRVRDNEASRDSISYLNAARHRAALAAPTGEPSEQE